MVISDTRGMLPGELGLGKPRSLLGVPCRYYTSVHEKDTWERVKLQVYYMHSPAELGADSNVRQDPLNNESVSFREIT